MATDCNILEDTTFSECTPIETGSTSKPSTCCDTTTKTSCKKDCGCCDEDVCAAPGINYRVKHLRGSDYANCAKDLKNRPYSIPYQSIEGCIENADGSVDYPIALRNMQVIKGGFKHILVADSGKTLQLLEPPDLDGDATLKYIKSLDSFAFVKDEGGSDVCADTCSDEELSGIVKEVADLKNLTSSETSEGVVVYTKTTVNGQTKLIQRLIDPCSILDCCKDISSFSTPETGDTTYRAIWRSRNTGIASCECLELTYEDKPEIEYRKQMLDNPVQAPVDLSAISINPSTGTTYAFDFGALAVVQPSWANRVILRVGITNKATPFDASNQQAKAYVASGVIPLVQVRMTANNESDQDHTGDVSVPISGTGFQLTAGSGVVNGAGILGTDGTAHFESNLWIMGFELVETP